MKRSPLRRVSKKRAVELREYSKRRARYLADHPVCEVWLRENRFQQNGGEFEFAEPSPKGEILTLSAEKLISGLGAPRATEIHHTNKRRGKMLNDEKFWLAVCYDNHKRIEDNKAWARANGFLLNF